MELIDNHNWIDEKDCFMSGFDKGVEAGRKESGDLNDTNKFKNCYTKDVLLPDS